MMWMLYIFVCFASLFFLYLFLRWQKFHSSRSRSKFIPYIILMYAVFKASFFILKYVLCDYIVCVCSSNVRFVSFFRCFSFRSLLFFSVTRWKDQIRAYMHCSSPHENRSWWVCCMKLYISFLKLNRFLDFRMKNFPPVEPDNQKQKKNEIWEYVLDVMHGEWSL